MAAFLPSDVLIQVFRLIPHPELYWHRYGLIDVSAVSRAWRAAAIQSASLWTRIRTETRRDRRLLQLLLERSRAAPLDVHLDLFCNEYGNVDADTTAGQRAEVVQALLPHVQRIQKLYIRHQTLEPGSEDRETVLRLVDAGLEFTLLVEYNHQRVGDEDCPEDDTLLNFTAPNLTKLSLDGVLPREWSTLLAPKLVQLNINANGTPLNIDLLGTIFQQCHSLASLTLQTEFNGEHPLFSPPGPNWAFSPPGSLRTLDLQMTMPDLLTVLALFSDTSILHSLTVCDDQGFTPKALARKKPPPILMHMLHGLDPIIAFEVHSDQHVLLRDAPGRTRRFEVAAEDDQCCEPAALWGALVLRCAAHRTVRTFFGATSAWGWLARTLERRQPDPPEGEGVELQIVLDAFGDRFPGDAPPLTVAALRTLKLLPRPGDLRPKCTAEAVQQVLSLVRTHRRGVVVCLGEMTLRGVPPRTYVAEYQRLADSLAGMWAQCAHCAARAEEIGRMGRWCVYCRAGDEGMKERCDDNWHRGWP
ncbi:hypothetical protein DFH06DRAFT_1480140 [Mycena polygramma]|nr:hypothetical protein DFH06DRAFT_1480140 [Mycena polygramma]